MAPPELLIEDAPERDRYEAHLDGELAGILEYVRKRGRIALIHTEVLPAFEGQGVGSAIVRFALDDARRGELLVIATCQYVQSYLDRHPEDDDIVVGRRRAGIRLTRGQPSRAQATASTNGWTAPLPWVRSSGPATVSVQPRVDDVVDEQDRAVEHGRPSRPRACRSRCRSCWALFSIAFWGAPPASDREARPHTAARGVGASSARTRRRVPAEVDGRAVTQVGAGSGRQRSRIARTDGVDEVRAERPVDVLPALDLPPQPASPYTHSAMPASFGGAILPLRPGHGIRRPLASWLDRPQVPAQERDGRPDQLVVHVPWQPLPVQFAHRPHGLGSGSSSSRVRNSIRQPVVTMYACIWASSVRRAAMTRSIRSSSGCHGFGVRK